MSNEQDTRLGILNSILTTPHRELMPTYKIHAEFISQDPLFYQHMAAWYCDKGDIRDVKEVFIINLCLSSFGGHRNIGLALLRKLPPFQVERIVNFIHNELKLNIPRSMVTEITRYLAEREGNPNWFDQSVLTARKSMKRLYSLLHIKPSDRAQEVLFEDSPPEDSQLYILKQVSKLDNPTDQARMLIESKIPYKVACSVIKNMTPAIIFALVDSMSSQELINNMGSLKKRGALDNEEIKILVDKKLKKAKTSKKVSALKGLEAVKNTNLSVESKAQLQDIADTQIKSKGRIKRPTALLIDKSSSMNQSIEIGKQMAAMISSVMADDVNFFCYAFDEIPMEIKSRGKDIGSWSDAFMGIKAQGCTGCGAPLVALKSKKQLVEQIVIITDEGENRSPAFLKALKDYAQTMNVEIPSVTMLRCGNRYSWGTISNKLINAGIETNVYEFSGDYYSLPNLIHFLTKPSKLDLLMEIMGYELPQRQIVVQQAS